MSKKKSVWKMALKLTVKTFRSLLAIPLAPLAALLLGVVELAKQLTDMWLKAFRSWMTYARGFCAVCRGEIFWDDEMGTWVEAQGRD